MQYPLQPKRGSLGKAGRQDESESEGQKHRVGPARLGPALGYARAEDASQA